MDHYLNTENQAFLIYRHETLRASKRVISEKPNEKQIHKQILPLIYFGAHEAPECDYSEFNNEHKTFCTSNNGNM